MKNKFSQTAVALMVSAAPLLAQTRREPPRLDPDDAYKNNCMRCHAATPQYAPGATQTIVMHMQARANLTWEEADAILEYLAGGPPAPHRQAQKSDNDTLIAALGPTPQAPPVQKPATQPPAAVQKPPAAQQPPARLEGATPPTPAVTAAQPFLDEGLAAFKGRRLRQAEIDFRKAVEADPKSAAAHWYLGYTTYKLAEPKRPFHPDKPKAAALFAKAYELDPSFQPVWQTKR